MKSARFALALGAALGFTVALMPGCSNNPKPIGCTSSNCDGCCDDQGTCWRGTIDDKCGNHAQSCAPCTSPQICSRLDPQNDIGGHCVSPTTGGGSGGSGGGSTGGGGGSGGSGGGSTGGGTGGAGGGSADGGTCNAQTCPNGCCKANGACVTAVTQSQCGTGGQTCSRCASTQTCVGGACTACNGCVDLNTGNCKAGTANGECGKNGAYCLDCAAMSQTCSNGACFTQGTCGAANCDGCCDNGTGMCVHPGSYSVNQCGQGQAGAACVTCNSSLGQTCDALDAGACTGPPPSDGGLFDLDGGLPGFCDATSPCPTGQCCTSLGLCLPSGTSALGLILCGSGGACTFCLSGLQTCSSTTYTCQ